MTTPAVGPSLGSEFTPSEIVLLYCDRFAPLPKQSRIAFEAGIASPFLIGMLIATMIVLVSNPTPAPIVLRVAAAMVDLALPVFWWLQRRKLDAAVYHGDVAATRPLDGRRMAACDELVGIALSAALLANEQAGNVELRVESGELIACFADSGGRWPTNSLEDQLRRERTLPVSKVVYDWLADGSHFPFTRACQLIEYCARRRGLQAKEPRASSNDGVPLSPAEMEDLARVEAMLNYARTERRAIWKALRTAVVKGLKDREVPPRYEQVGQTQIPKYYYRELPIESLEAAEPEDEVLATRIASSVAEPLQKTNRLVQILVLAVVLSGLLFALWMNPENRTPTLVNAAVMLLAILTMDSVVTRAWHRLRALRQSYGLAPESAGSKEEHYRRLTESATRIDKLAGWMTMVALAALPGAIWGGWTVLIVLAGVGLLWFIQYIKLHEFKEDTAPDIVRTRLARLAEAEAVAAAPAPVAPQWPAHAEGVSAEPAERWTGPRIPEHPMPAHQLPRASPETLEVLDRWERRRRAYELLQWKSFAALITGYVGIVLAFWNSPGKEQWTDPGDSFTRYMPFIPVFLLAATGMFFAWKVANHFKDRRSAVEEPRAAEEVGFGVWPLIAIWRVLILLTAPLLFGMGRQAVPAHHLAFAATMLLFVAAHWGWTEWEIRRLLLAMPVPEPHRLVLLRVFGSPAFDDLVALIQPWRRVGCIEHLEGFDTVGRSENVIAALDAGDIDRALVKTLPEIQAQFGEALYDPDRDLLFRRHAFQCTNTIWQEAVNLMLDRADAVLMDLSSLSFERQGCAWELGQLLDRVPLSKVTLLVNDNTDMRCLRQILETAAQRMPAGSPNRNSTAAWQLISIGGLSARQPNQSYHDWKRRLDQRLDSVQLAAWLLATAGSARAGRTAVNSPSEVRYWRQSRWAWLVLLILSAVWSGYLAGHFVPFR